MIKIGNNDGVYLFDLIQEKNRYMHTAEVQYINGVITTGIPTANI